MALLTIRYYKRSKPPVSMNRYLFVWLLTVTQLVLAQTDPQLILNTGGHRGVIKDLAVTSDGKTIISAGHDKVIRIWNTQTGLLMDEIRGQQSEGSEGKIFALALSPDNQYLAVGGFLKDGTTEDDNFIRLYDYPNRRLIGLLKGHTNVVNALSFSNDSHYLVSGSADQTVRVWQMPTSGTTLRTTPTKTFDEHKNLVYGVAMHGSLIVSASYDKTIKFWHLDNESSVVTRIDHTGRCDAIAISPNGQIIVSGGNDQQLIVYDRSGKKLQQIDNQTSPSVIQFAPDGRQFVCGSYTSGSDKCNLYEKTGNQWRKKTTFSNHDNTVEAAGFLDNQTVVTAGGDRKELIIWRTNGTQVRSLHGQGMPIWAVSYVPGVLAYTQTWTQRLGLSTLTKQFDITNRTIGPSATGVTFPKPVMKRGNYSLTHESGGDFNYSDASLLLQENGKTIATITRNAINGLTHNCYTFGPDQTILSGGANGSLYAYDFSGKEIGEFVGHTSDIWGLTISADGNWLVSGSDDQVIKLWPLAELGKKQIIEPLLSFFVGTDGEWVIWHPSGYYDASPNGEKYIGWHVNRGYDKIADYYPVASFRRKFHQPDFITRLIETGSIEAATQTLAGRQMQDISEQRPPSVQWQFPASRYLTVSSPTLRTSVRIASTTPVQLIKFLVNKRNGYENRGLKVGQVSGTLVEQDISLQPGDNELEVLVRNADAEVTSDKRIITYNPPVQDIYKPTLYVLLVGVSQYQETSLKLNYAHQDALDLAQLLQRQQGGLYKEVVIKTLTNTEATQRTIKIAFTNLKKQATQRDVVLVLMAGHGVTTRDNIFYFLPYDVESEQVEATAIKYSDITDVLGALPCKVITLLDMCHAGALAKASQKRRDLQPNLTEFIRELTSESVGVVTFCASQPRESSVESDEWKNGAFTEALLEGLNGKADYDRNNVITINEINLYITDRVKVLTKGEQHPGLYSPNALSSFPFIVPAR